jgi:hypothetical protein
MEWSLEIVLIVLLAATLFHALRLERALGVLKRDRAELEALIVGFNDSTRKAEQGIDRLRQTADGAGRQIARQIEVANGIKEDLAFLGDRGERLAERLDGLIRSARVSASEPAVTVPSFLPALPPPSVEPARLLRGIAPRGVVTEMDAADEDKTPRLRSQAERDLLKALRLAR